MSGRDAGDRVGAVSRIFIERSLGKPDNRIWRLRRRLRDRGRHDSGSGGWRRGCLYPRRFFYP